MRPYRRRKFSVRRGVNPPSPDATFATLSYSSDLDHYIVPQPADAGETNDYTNVFLNVAGNELEGFNEFPIKATNNRVPLGFKTYFDQYRKYTVYAASLDVTVYPAPPAAYGRVIDPSPTVAHEMPNNTGLPMLVAMAPITEVTGGYAPTATLFNGPYSMKKVCSTTSQHGVRMKQYMTSSKMLGVDYGKDTTQGAVTMASVYLNAPATEPNIDQRWRWNVAVDLNAMSVFNQQFVSPPNIPNLYKFQVFYSWKVKYYVKFFNRKHIDAINIPAS